MKKQYLITIIIYFCINLFSNASGQIRTDISTGLTIHKSWNGAQTKIGPLLSANVLFRISNTFLLGPEVGIYKVKNVKFVPLLLNARFVFNREGDRFRPYVGFGVGSYRYTVTYSAVGYSIGSDQTNKVSQSKIGFAPHCGFYIKLSDMVDLKTDVKYNTLSAGEGSALKYVDIGIGVSLKLAQPKK